MQLTAEALLDVLRHLRSDGPTAIDATGGPNGMRRRRMPRVGVRLHLTILPCSTPSHVITRARPVTVRLRNISRRGVGFVHSRPLEVGQAFIVTLPRQAGGIIHLLGNVERCRPLDSDTWDIGGSIRLDVPRQEMDQHLRTAGIAA